VGIPADASRVAVFDRSATTILSPRGFARLPVTSPHPCGFVSPIGDDEVVRLHGGVNAAWPTRLQRYGGRRWETIQRVRMPDRGECGRVFAENVSSPTALVLTGGGRQLVLRVKPRGNSFVAVRAGVL